MSIVVTRETSDNRQLDRFYQKMAILCAAVAFVGFLPSYWAPMWNSTLQIPRLVHFHGIIFFAWMIFFVLQTSLVAHAKTALHRELGLLGIALATAMIFTGTMASVNQMNHFAAQGFGDEARAFALVPLSAIAYFAVVVVYAVANIKRPDTHKRAMVLATVALLQPAVARWFGFFLASPDATGPIPVMLTIGPGIVSDLPLFYALIHDKFRHGRPHKVYVVGAITLVALQLVRVPISDTAAWLSLAEWFSEFSG